MIDQVLTALGHTITVFPAPSHAGPAQGSIGADGNPILTALPAATPAAGVPYLGYAYQVPPSKRGQYGAVGADITQPLWEVIVRYDAPLTVPGFSLSAQGVGLPYPVALKPIQDADNLGSEGVAWMVLCHATRALEG